MSTGGLAAGPGALGRLHVLTDVAAAVSVPVLAIGGVRAADVPDPLAAGAWVVAVTAVSNAVDPSAATRSLFASLAR